MRRVTRGRRIGAATLCAVLIIALTAGLVEAQTFRDSRTGIEIAFRADQSIFPASWRRPPINAQADEIAPSEIERTRAAIDLALSKYPAQLVSSNLRAIFVVGRIRFYGLTYGATNSSDAIYIANSGRRSGYTDLVLEGSVHHEFSSILLRRNPTKISVTEWSRFNPSGFEYLGTGVDAIRQGAASTRYDASLARTGFFSEYSMASFEEDFNIIVEMLFLGDSDLWKAYDEFPPIQGKVDLAIAFYNSLAPVYTETFFRSQSR